MNDATIKDVAKDAGVSIATVSRVLNGNYFVSPELIDKVMTSVNKLNYFPNSIARSLKNDATHTIGLIVSDIANSFFTLLARAVEDVINEHGYNLIVCSTDNQQKKEYEYLQLLQEKKVDGIILNTTGKNNPFVTSISQNTPIALCGRRVNDSTFKGDFVDSDNPTGTYTLTMQLIEMGHRKIGVVNGQSHVSSAQERWQGFCRAMNSIGIYPNNDYPYLYNGDFNRAQSGVEGAAQLLESDDPPTAIVAMNNELTLGVLRYCKEKGVQIPQNLSLCCYGDIANSDLLYVHPSSVTMNPWQIGARLANMIMERIENKNNLFNREAIFTPHLILGNSVGKPNG